VACYRVTFTLPYYTGSAGSCPELKSVSERLQEQRALLAILQFDTVIELGLNFSNKQSWVLMNLSFSTKSDVKRLRWSLVPKFAG
jgi:hypothetical protein